MATAEVKKEKRAIVKRSDEDLKKSVAGKVTIIVATAMALANENDRKGLKFETKAGKEGAKQLSAKMTSVTGNKGKIATMKEKDPNFVTLVDLAKKALPELTKETYGANSQGLLNFCLETLTAKESKRGFNPKRLEGITL